MIEILPFRYEYMNLIKEGKYQVKTSDGREARIVCWDAKSYARDNDLIVLVKNKSGETETIQRYGGDGKLIANRGTGHNDAWSLVLTREVAEPLKIFESAMLRYLQEASNQNDDEKILLVTKKHTKSLMNAAMVQLECDGYTVSKSDFPSSTI